MHIHNFLAQRTYCRRKWATARPLHANLIDDDGSEMQAAFVSHGAFEDNLNFTLTSILPLSLPFSDVFSKKIPVPILPDIYTQLL